MSNLKRYRYILGWDPDRDGPGQGGQVRIDAEGSEFVDSGILDPILLKNIEVASRPTISPSPVLVLQLDTPTSVPFTDLNLGPWTFDAQNPVAGNKGTADSVILYVSLQGASGITVGLKRKAATIPAETMSLGNKFDFPTGGTIFLRVDADQLVQYKVDGKGLVEIRFVGHFEKARIA